MSEEKTKRRMLGVLVGRVLTAVDTTDAEVVFTAEAGDRYKLYHQQDCCEHVELAEVVGDVRDLVGSPVTLAEEVTHVGVDPEGVTIPGSRDASFTWTFYRMATAKGMVVFRFYGESNGYYSERVSLAADVGGGWSRLYL